MKIRLALPPLKVRPAGNADASIAKLVFSAISPVVSVMVPPERAELKIRVEPDGEAERVRKDPGPESLSVVTVNVAAVRG